MYKVLIAEDEERILRGIKNMIDWDALGLSVVHLAANGKEAYEMFCREPADIVVTDISMPGMSGLELIGEIRRTDRRARCMILTGYDDFDYAKAAIPMDVEDYILKPISEEGLTEALLKAKKKLEDMDYKYRLFDFLEGKVSKEDFLHHADRYGLPLAWKRFCAAVMIWKAGRVQGGELFSCLKTAFRQEGLEFYYEGGGEILILKEQGTSSEADEPWFVDLQNRLEGEWEVGTFLSISKSETEITALPSIYHRLRKLQKYLLVEGYGFCIHEDTVANRESRLIAADEEKIRRFLIHHDWMGFKKYLDELLAAWMDEGGKRVEDLYKLFVKIAIILQKIFDEFALEKTKSQYDMLDIIEAVYETRDLASIKGTFAAAAAAAAEELRMEDSQFSPVIRRVLREVQAEDGGGKNLKVLAAEYNVNASYLGQLFQKEVGCSFTSYANQLKNAKARELILNTDMKITEIARQLGYEETSYFYRKFKQCYGVSPASLREMKKD